MADTVPGGSPAAPAPAKPPTIGEKISFSIPAIIIALVLSIGISYAILAMVNGNTREELTKAMNEKESALKNQLGEVQKKNSEMEKSVDALNKNVDTLSKEKAKLADALELTSKGLKDMVDSYTTFKKGQEQLDTTQNQSIAETKDNINKVDTRVHYIEDKLKKLDEIAADVNSLKGDTSELKKEYTVLKGDLNAVKNKADVTEKDLADLGERARLFQLRVLAARAREAADAARKSDLKTLINRLEDVEDK